MNLYKVPIDNRRKELNKHEHKRAWKEAREIVDIINIVGICVCINLCVYVAFNAF